MMRRPSRPLAALMAACILTVMTLSPLNNRAYAGGGGYIVDVIEAVDWSWLLQSIIDGFGADGFLCFCPTGIGIPRIGIKMRYWQPQGVIEETAEPGYFPLWGFSVPMPFAEDKRRNEDQGKLLVGAQENQDPHARYAHYWNFPLFGVLQLLGDLICLRANSIDLGYASELDPTWSHPELLGLLTPIILAIATPIGAAVAAVDCGITTVFGPNKVSDKLFFTLGCWGMTYPLTGFIMTQNYTLDGDSLIMGRVVAKMHAIAQLWATTQAHTGDRNWCYASIYPILPKNEYLFTIVAPTFKKSKKGSSSSGKKGSSSSGKKSSKGGDRSMNRYALGQSVVTYPEVGKTVPFKEYESVFLLYKKIECCAL